MAETNGSANGVAGNDFDAAAIVDDLLAKVCNDQEIAISVDDQATLSNAKTELENLMEIQDLLNKRVEAKKQEVEDLLLRISPLMAFDDKLLAKLASYQDEASLLELEKSMAELVDPDLVDSNAFTRQWEFLVRNRQFSSNFIDAGPRERCLRFVQASRYAQQMELHAMYHYNPRQYITKEYEWPDKFYTIEDFRHEFDGWDNGEEAPPTMELFVRVTYREGDHDDSPTRVLLEGFMSDYSDLDPWADRDTYTIINLGTNDTGAHMVFNDIHLLDDPNNMGLKISQNWRGKRIMEWPEDEQKAYMKRISVTCLACKTLPDGTLVPTLVAASRGYKASHKDCLAIMSPRPYLAKARTANLLNCVNVGIKPTEEGKHIGFRLLVDWGTQENFTRRKSILDAF